MDIPYHDNRIGVIYSNHLLGGVWLGIIGIFVGVGIGMLIQLSVMTPSNIENRR